MKRYHSRLFYKEIKPVIAKNYTEGLTIREIASRHKISEKFVWDSLSELGVNRRRGSKECRRHHFNEDFFNSIDTEEKAYILGFIYADGYVSKNSSKQRYMLRVVLDTKDEQILHDINKALLSNKPVVRGTRVTKKGYVSKFSTLALYSKKVVLDLEKLGCLSPKALSIRFPYFLTGDLCSHFIRGYFDGDGHISLDKAGLPVVHLSSNPSFIKDLHAYFTEVIKLPCHIIEQSNNTHVLSLHSWSGALSFGEYIWRNATIYLDRKHATFVKLQEVHRQKQKYKNKLRYEKDYLLKLYTELGSWKKVHKFIGIPESTLHYHLRKAGL